MEKPQDHAILKSKQILGLKGKVMRSVKALVTLVVAALVFSLPAAAKTYQVKNAFFPQDKLGSFYFDERDVLKLTMKPNSNGDMVTLGASDPSADEYLIKDELVSSIEVNADRQLVFHVEASTVGSTILIAIQADQPEAGNIRRIYTYTGPDGTTHTLEQHWDSTNDKSSNPTGALLLDGVAYTP